MRKRPSYRELLNKVELLSKRVAELEGLAYENETLKKRLAKYETPKKNSRNSSVPPSQDQNRLKKNQSLRKPSGKKPGGQKGREGKTLEMTADPDVVIELQPLYCRNCGSSLENTGATKGQSRQKVDIPPIKAIFTEYQTFSKVCNCGCQNTADFPQGVSSPVSYGENIEALIGYFHARHYFPFGRMQEVFNDVFNIDISEGGIHYLLNRFSDKVTPVYEIIKQRVAESKVVGGDETGVKVNGDKHWFWTWQSPKLTFITHSENRKGDTVKTHFPQGFPNSTLVHDGWKPQLNTPAQSHQSCLAHLQRHLNYLNELYESNIWGNQFLELLYDSLGLKRDMGHKDYIYNVERTKIIVRLDHLLTHPPDKKDKKLYTFFNRMCRERQHLFVFLFIEEVPPDNNASERAIRNVKVKQKISGQFKIKQAAQDFAKIRSVIDTTIKNGLNVLESLALIAKFEFQF
ncbi:MAG: IS66 family transposase [Gammaproteobacteria bacterium]|nr:IS66 family transposase [Gammaproteobacteria bacterium]